MESLNSGTYGQFVKLLDNYNPDVKVAENPTQGELHEEQEFLNKIFSSQILRKGYEFLQNHFYVKNLAEFREKIHTLWFELYDRDGNSRVNTLGSRYVQ